MFMISKRCLVHSKPSRNQNRSQLLYSGEGNIYIDSLVILRATHHWICRSRLLLTPTPGLDVRATWLQKVVQRHEVVGKAPALEPGLTWV